MLSERVNFPFLIFDPAQIKLFCRSWENRWFSLISSLQGDKFMLKTSMELFQVLQLLYFEHFLQLNMSMLKSKHISSKRMNNTTPALIQHHIICLYA
jgi:hypothetical protein